MKPQKLTYQQRMLIQTVGIDSFQQILRASPGFLLWGHIIVVVYADLDHLMRFAQVFCEKNHQDRTFTTPGKLQFRQFQYPRHTLNKR